MQYEKIIWKNRVVERPRTFTVTNNPDGTLTLTPSEGFIIEAGTPLVAENFNRIENALETLYKKQIHISSTPPDTPEGGQLWLEIT